MGYFDLLEGVDYVANSDFHLIQCETADVFEQAEALPFWSQEYTQLSKGVFNGSINSVRHNGIQIFSESMNRAVDQVARAPQDCYVIGLPTIVEGESVWGHLPLKKQALITLGKNADLFFRTSSISEIVAVVIPANRLESYAKNMDWQSFNEAMTLIKPVEPLDPEISGRLLNILMYGLKNLPSNSPGVSFIERWDNFEEDLLSACLQALMHASKNIHPYYFDHRIPRYIVNRVRDITLASDGYPLGIEDLCDQLRIKRRTLNQAFSRALGITPLTYMRNLKLQKIRMELMAYPDEIPSIANVASKWGFVHMSLFSRYYRELFGECPIETLCRLRTRD